MSLTILIAGFGRFPGVAHNPTGALAARLARRRRPSLADTVRVAHTFRTSYAAVARELPALIARHQPDVILLFGIAARTPHLRIETRAVNRRSLVFADVDGYCPETPAICPGGPAARHGRAPHRQLMVRATGAGVAAKLSRNAGTYLCNFAYWLAIESTRANDGAREALVQFIHVPKIAPSGRPSRPGARKPMTLDRLGCGGEAMLMALAAAARRQRISRCARGGAFDDRAGRLSGP
jgi:pyroglutamyl-peptidase